MRITLIIFIGIHSIIHLIGFLKAFGIFEFNTPNQSISKILGLFWLLAFLLFAVAIVLNLIQSNYWWFGGFLALIVSQVLIFNFWSDAKFGTIANIIILPAIIVAYSNYNFKKQIKEERITIFNQSTLTSPKIVSKTEVSSLPVVIQKWLTQSGIIGKPKASNVYLTQELQLRLKPKQAKWNNGTAQQYFTTQPPAFNWNIDARINPFLRVVGRDKFENGKGEMLIKLFSLFPVAYAKNEDKVNQATLQRYLAEIVWFPSASLAQYIKWETVDNFTAKATMDYNGTVGSGKFYFDEEWNFKQFVAMRYKDPSDTNPKKWKVIATKTEERNGIKIPTECEVSWELENGKWTWLKLKITDIQYNLNRMPLANNVYKK